MFMPATEYMAIVIVIKIIIIACVIFLWWKSVKGFSNNKILVPGLMNLLSYLMLWLGGYTVIVECYQCTDLFCPNDHTILSHGFLGIKIFTVEDEERQCEHYTIIDEGGRLEHAKESSIVRTAQIRYWGGLIPFLPDHRQLIHKFFVPRKIDDDNSQLFYSAPPFPRAYKVYSLNYKAADNSHNSATITPAEAKQIDNQF